MGNTTCDGNCDRNNNIAAKKPRVSLGVDNRKEDVTEQIKEKEEQNLCVDGLVVHFIVLVARQVYTCDKWHLDH